MQTDESIPRSELNSPDFSGPNETSSFEPTPNDPPWSSLEAVSVWFLSVLVILLIPGLFLIPYLAYSGAAIESSGDMVEFAKSDPMAVVLQIIAIIPAHLLTILFVWLIVTRWRKLGFLSTLGWKSGPFAWWHYLILLGGFFMIAAIVGNFFPEKENELIRILRSSRYAVYVVAFIATVTAPIVEEMVYRGVLYSAFQRTFGIPSAFLLVTFMFAIVHVPQYYPSYTTIFLLTLLSVMLTSVRVISGNLLPCVILHTLFNGLQSVFLILQPYAENPDVQARLADVLYK